MENIVQGQWFRGPSADLGDTIDQSLRFSGAQQLNRPQPATATNRRTFTLSMWIKKATSGSSQQIFNAESSAAGSAIFGFYYVGSDETIQIYEWTGSAYALNCITNAVFRDPSAWYHYVLRVDTTQATANDRVRLYVNGEQQTFATNTQPSQNYETNVNSASGQSIRLGQANSSVGGGQPLDGYMADVYFIDGQALDPTNFGRYNEDGVWVPQDYTGTYGTNGYKLVFDSSAGIGDDSSGNGNDFTASGFDTTAISSSNFDNDIDYNDTPTSNYSTPNPLDAGSSNLVFSKANLDIGSASGNWTDCRSTFAVSSGKWYWETRLNTVASVRPFVGILNPSVRPASNSGSTAEQLGETTNSYAYWTSGGSLRHNAVDTTVTTAVATDIVQVALDMDNGKIYFGLNNTYFDSSGGSTGNPSTGSNPSYSGITLDTVSPAFEVYNNTSSVSVNFGQHAFAFTPPTGFSALQTNNLPEPTIKNGKEHFDIYTYTSASTAADITFTGWEFQPDLVWFKCTSHGSSHRLYDSVRGVNEGIQSNTTNAESTDTNAFNSFDSNGFSLGTGNTDINYDSRSFVAWGWKAGTSYTPTVTGFTSPSASINTEAGFGIYKFTGNNTASSFTHGLDSTPELIIAKPLDISSDWAIFPPRADGPPTATDTYQRFNEQTDANKNGQHILTGNTSTTVSVASFGETASNSDYVYYLWHSVEGFSKFGRYTGNNSTDGPFIYTGFRPAFILIKGPNITSNWFIYDSAREANNPMQNIIMTNTNGNETPADTGTNGVDFLANGFKLRSTNGSINSSTPYFYMTFAENPFGGENAPPVTAR